MSSDIQISSGQDHSIPIETANIQVSALDVSKSVQGPDGRIEILNGVNLQVLAGASLAVVGASGSGKTTLLALLAGLDTPTRGAISLAGVRVDTLGEEPRAALRRRHVGFVFQSFHLLPALNAEENVMLPLELDGRDDARALAQSALADVGLASRLHHYPHQLSGGEQQRVALARAFIVEPPIVMADEPTGNLDSVNGEKVLELLLSRNNNAGTTLVLVTHDPQVAALAHRKIVLRDGLIVEDVLLADAAVVSENIVSSRIH
jgi:putative ABC transport system ATP-binding protein